MSQTPADMRRVVYLVPELDNVCVRHRVDPFTPALERRGWKVEKLVVPKGLFGRLQLFRGLDRAAVVVVVRKLFRTAALRVLRSCAKKLVYDFDDALMYRDSSSEDLESAQRERLFARTVGVADRVIAGNDYLGELATRAGAHVMVIPTCVDDVRLTPASSPRAAGRTVIGWIGSRSTLMYLESLKGAFEELGKRYGGSVALKVVCDAFPPPMGIEQIQKPWALADEPADLRSFDIGVMPLTDDAWTRGKCGLKLLQYLAVGIPAVASPVGVSGRILDDGRTGFLAKEPGDWVRALAKLIDDAELRARVGRAGRESLRGRYTVADWTERYVRVIEDAAGAT